ncbi:MAG: HAMP domain-containing sensor histidine kinase, partial [Pseudomonadota bacterium]|nr:HAMP domain-containing sensor histidine kinase [Pseudomonadota bacterium]
KICQQIISLVSTQYNKPLYKLDYEGEGVTITGYPGPIKQALMNIVLNAAQATAQKGFVKIYIKEENQNIHVKVLDSGHGITQQNLKRIFDPFFTTKPEGQGQGLGLSVAYTAVEQHQGKINVSSKEGKGTVFEIILPKYFLVQDAEK